MAYANKVIRQPHIRQTIRFLRTAKETGGELLEMESNYDAHSSEPPPHYHPQQAEDFRVEAGEISVRMHGKVNILKAGDNLHIPANTVHAMWNHTRDRSVVNWQVRPAMDTEYFLETMIGLANDGQTDSSGKPGLLQLALSVPHFAPVFRLTQPPYWLQRVLFTVLAPFARIRGKQAVYDRYLD